MGRNPASIKVRIREQLRRDLDAAFHETSNFSQGIDIRFSARLH